MNPQCPGQPVANFLQHHLTREPQLRVGVSLSWQEVYCLVSSYPLLLQALAASYPSRESYDQGILGAAAPLGLKAPEVLLSVLWHAPRGNARQHPEILDYLQQLVAAAHIQPGRRLARNMSRGDCPWIMPGLRAENLLAVIRGRGRGVFLEDAGLNRLNPGGLCGPPFPVARSGGI